MRALRVAAIAVVALLALGLSISLAVHNYRECRGAGFGRLYCASTHLVR